MYCTYTTIHTIHCQNFYPYSLVPHIYIHTISFFSLLSTHKHTGHSITFTVSHKVPHIYKQTIPFDILTVIHKVPHIYSKYKPFHSTYLQLSTIFQRYRRHRDHSPFHSSVLTVIHIMVHTYTRTYRTFHFTDSYLLVSTHTVHYKQTVPFDSHKEHGFASPASSEVRTGSSPKATTGLCTFPLPSPWFHTPGLCLPCRPGRICRL
jgi:hypothetical protein